MPDDEKFLPRQTFLPKEVAFRHIAYVLEQGFQFHAKLWSDDPKIRQETRDYIRNHHSEFRARERSFALFLNYYGPRLGGAEKEKPVEPDAIDIEKLEEMNLSDEKLKELAGIKEK